MTHFAGLFDYAGNLEVRVRVNREIKHDVNGREQTTKRTSDLEFFSSIP